MDKYSKIILWVYFLGSILFILTMILTKNDSDKTINTLHCDQDIYMNGSPSEMYCENDYLDEPQLEIITNYSEEEMGIIITKNINLEYNCTGSFLVDNKTNYWTEVVSNDSIIINNETFCCYTEPVLNTTICASKEERQ